MIKSSLGYGQGSSSSHSKLKESINLIKFQSSKQLENPKIVNIEACKYNIKKEPISGKKQENKKLVNKPVQSRNHEKESNVRVKHSYQNYKYEHQNSIHYFPRNQPKVMYFNFFNGYCFCYSNFGHRAANYFYNFRNFQWRIPSNNQMIH